MFRTVLGILNDVILIFSIYRYYQILVKKGELKFL